MLAGILGRALVDRNAFAKAMHLEMRGARRKQDPTRYS